MEITEINGYVSPNKEWPVVDFSIIEEGTVEFRIPDAETIYDAPAFFNPQMALNRDLSIIFSKLYSEKRNRKLRILDPLAGIGVRSIRLLRTIESCIEEIVINDFDEVTSKIASFNTMTNHGKGIITVFRRELRSLVAQLAEHHFKYHYIDLDPFGPPTPYMDTIWNALPLSGLVSITATDMTALCGVYPEACLRKYGAYPLNNFHTHETAARILISTVGKSAARLGFGVVPIFTASVDHYVKIFFLARKSRGEANTTLSNIGYSYTCRSCFQIYYVTGLNSHAPKCCDELDKAGPLWTGNLFDREWANLGKTLLDEQTIDIKFLPTYNRCLKLFQEGIEADNLPGYYAIDEICKSMKITQPKREKIFQRLQEMGYKAIKTEFRKQSIRTDAPAKILRDVIKLLI